MKKLAAAPFVLVAEAWNVKTGLGSRFGSYLLQAGFKGKYNHIGTHKEGSGGLWQQMGFQGLDSEGIAAAIESGLALYASLTMVKAGRPPRTTVATGELPLRVDELQYRTGEGPCLQALEQSDIAHAPDLTTDQQWPTFAKLA